MTLLRFIASAIYAVAGVSGCCVFLFFENYPAGLLALVTGILSFILSHLHLLNHKERLQEWYRPKHLLHMGFLGFCGFAIGTPLGIFYTVIEIMEKRPITPINDSAVISLIWAFMCLKSGLFLLFFGVLYSRQLIRLERGPEEQAIEEAANLTNNEITA